MPFTVYLSSTLKDLEAERKGVQDALGDECIVRHSYRASEDALVESCLNDVAQCDLYIVIPASVRIRSDARSVIPRNCRSRSSSIDMPGRKALHGVFLKDESAVPYTQTDARTKEHPPEDRRLSIERERRPAQGALQDNS
jgi:hypothetical protein